MFPSNTHPTLEPFFSPVSYESDLGESPLRVTLLGRHFVLARLGGRVTVLPDRCPHRGAPLSLGSIKGGAFLQCPYHGLCFDSHGSCFAAPDATASTIPRLALALPEALVWRGLIFVALRSPALSLPALSELDRPNRRLIVAPVQQWKANAAQMVDNFLDVSHFPFVHSGSFSTSASTPTHPSTPEILSDGFQFTFSHQGHKVTGDPLRPGAAFRGQTTLRLLRYRYYLPFIVSIAIEYPELRTTDTILLFVQPEGPKLSRLFKLISVENLPLSASAEEQERACQMRINDEDKRIVEALPDAPPDTEQPPTDLPGDAPGIALRAYFRRMLEMSQTARPPTEHRPIR
jgi:vanillate O-demethylase monooxygenase subunit